MATPVDTARSAVVGIPPDPKKKPDNEMLVRAFEEIYDEFQAVESLVTTGVQNRPSVRFRSTSTGTLATAFVPGTVHDGVTALLGDEFILDRGGVAHATNGIYVVQAAGVPLRRADCDTPAELGRARLQVRKGAISGGTYYLVKEAPSAIITIDVTPVTWQDDGIAVGQIEGFSVNPSTGDIDTVLYSLKNSIEAFPGNAVDRRKIRIRPPIYAKQGGPMVDPFKKTIAANERYPHRAVDKRHIYIPEKTETSSGSSGDAGWGLAYWAAQDASARGHAAVVAARKPPEMQGVWSTFNLSLGYGQSRKKAAIAHRPKTTSVPAWGIKAYQVGGSVRASAESNTFVAFNTTHSYTDGIDENDTGPFLLAPLVATMDIDNPTAGDFYDPVAYVGEDALDGINGEASEVAGVYVAWKLWNTARGEPSGNYGYRYPIAAVHGSGGQLLQNLLSDANMPGTSFSAKLLAQNFITQLAAHVPASYALAGSPSGPVAGTGATLSMWFADLYQGEANAGANTPKATYRGYLEDWRDWVIDDLCAGILGQALPPMFALVAISQDWIMGSDGGVPQAQLEFVLETPGVYMIAPSYAVTSKMDIPIDGVTLPFDDNGHHDPNGQRWMGCYRACLDFEVRVLGRDPEPMHALVASFKGGDPHVLVSLHTPVGPLVVDDCFFGYKRVELASWGLVVKQGGTEYALVAKQQLGTNSVLLTVDRDMVAGVGGQVEICLADGRSNLRDSNPAVAPLNFELAITDFAAKDPDPDNMTAQDEAIQADVEAELADIIGQPYPLWNWAVPQIIALTEITD